MTRTDDGPIKNHPRTPAQRSQRIVLVFVLGVMALATMLVGSRSFETLTYRAEAVTRAEQEAAAFVGVLEKYVRQHLDDIDLGLKSIVDRVERSSSVDTLPWDQMISGLSSVKDEVLETDIVGADGIIIRSSRPAAVGTFYPDTMLIHRSQTSVRMSLGARASCNDCPGPYSITAARSLWLRSGQFVGTIVVRLDPSKIEEAAGLLGNSFGGTGRITLDNGQILASEPPTAYDGLPRDSEVDRSGKIVVTPWDTNPDYLVAYRYMDDYGLVVSFTLDKHKALKNWENALLSSIIMGLSTLLLGGTGAYLFWRMLKQQMVIEASEESRRDELESLFRAARIAGFRWYPQNGDFVAATDPNGVINTGPREKPTIKTLLRLFPQEEAQTIQDAITDCMKTGAEHRLELTAIRREGEKFESTYAITTFRHQKNKGGSHVFVVCQDITEWQETRNQHAHLLKMDAVGQITGGVAHDFNNLLVVILGNIEEIMDDLPDDDPRSTLLDVTLGASMQARELTKRLLAFARKQPLQPTSINVTALVSNMRSLLTRTIGEHVSLLVDAEKEDVQWNVRADRSQLEIAILNLAINSRDSLDGDGSITIRVRNRTLNKADMIGKDDFAPGEYVDIMVEDNGRGMTEDVASRAVEPYFTTKPPGEGSGLGLSQVYGFVKQSGGHFQISSDVGKGTVIHMYLPRATRQVTESEQIDIEAGFEFGTETVLVVEDDEAVRAHIDRVLTGLGYKVLSRIDGKSALELVSQGVHFDLLLTDVMLAGGMSGVQLAQKVLELREGIPVVYVSGYAKDMINEGRTTADVNFLQKPFLRGELGRKIRAALEGFG